MAPTPDGSAGVSQAFDRDCLDLAAVCPGPLPGPPATGFVGLCAQLAAQGVAVVLVGDREFGAVEVLRQLDRWGWDYALRIKGDAQVRLCSYL